jgi:integrase
MGERRGVDPKRAEKVLPVLSVAQTHALFAACRTARNRAILAVLLDKGVRARELTGLTMDRVFFSPDDAYLLGRGKGKKQREVGLGRRSRMLLHKYLPGPGPGWRQGLCSSGGQGIRVGAHVWRHTHAYRYIAAGGTYSDSRG